MHSAAVETLASCCAVNMLNDLFSSQTTQQAAFLLESVANSCVVPWQHGFYCVQMTFPAHKPLVFTMVNSCSNSCNDAIWLNHGKNGFCQCATHSHNMKTRKNCNDEVSHSVTIAQTPLELLLLHALLLHARQSNNSIPQSKMHAFNLSTIMDWHVHKTKFWKKNTHLSCLWLSPLWSGTNNTWKKQKDFMEDVVTGSLALFCLKLVTQSLWSDSLQRDQFGTNSLT